MKDLGITTTGCDANGPKFCPNDYLKRKELAVFIIRGIYGTASFSYQADPPYFADVPSSDWSFPFVQKMKEMGITAGCSSMQFCPDDLATGFHVAVFTNRAAQRRPGNPFFVSGDQQVAVDNSFQPISMNPWFTDVQSDHFYFRWIQWARDIGIIKTGCTATRFCPDNPITRGVMSYYVIRGIRDEYPPPNYYTSNPKLPASSQIQGNGAFIPIDMYEDTNSGQFPVYPCSSSLKVRECMQHWAANMNKQGVTNLRFFFGLRGGGGSTAIEPSGDVRETWIDNLKLFFQDLAAAGITSVSLHPALAFTYEDAPIPATLPDCHGTLVSRFFWITSPVAYRHDTAYPDNAYPQDSLNCSPANPYFIGWDKIYNVLDRVVKAAVSKGLTVSEIEQYAEMNLADFTVDARWVYDNKHGEDIQCEINGEWQNSSRVQTCIGRVMEINGFSRRSVTPSVTESRSTDGSSCLSVYGDSARVFKLSQLHATLTGGRIGRAQSDFPGGLECGGNTLSQEPVPFPTQETPDIVHLHSYPCVATAPLNPSCNLAITGTLISNEFKLLSNAIDDFRNRRWPGAQIVFGETHGSDVENKSGSQGTVQCPGPPISASVDMVNGFNASNLASQNVMFRPFNQFAGDPLRQCVPWPANWNKGNGPFAKQ